MRHCKYCVHYKDSVIKGMPVSYCTKQDIEIWYKDFASECKYYETDLEEGEEE